MSILDAFLELRVINIKLMTGHVLNAILSVTRKQPSTQHVLEINVCLYFTTSYLKLVCTFEDRQSLVGGDETTGE